MPKLPPERQKELKITIAQMHGISSGFYVQATRLNCHPFVEFCGLMNEYIKCCEQALEDGIDFTLCNIHTGQHLPIRSYEKMYLREKLECIFTGSITIVIPGQDGEHHA